MKARSHASLIVLLVGFVALLGAAISSTAWSEVVPIPRKIAPLVRTSKTVVLVAIDGVRWKEVFEGVDPALAELHDVPKGERVDARTLVPHLHRLATVEGAAIGAPASGSIIRASGPNFVSLPGYFEMLTGRRQPGCYSNDCGIVDYSTVADDARRLGASDAGVVASWPLIERAATAVPGSVAVSAGRSGVAGRARFGSSPGVIAALAASEKAGPAPGHGDFRRDANSADLALHYLVSRRPSFLFLGLGETDEYAHDNDYAAYLNALRRADAVVGRLAAALGEMTRRGHPSTLLVTTDHGRARSFADHGSKYPESARVWLIASGAGIEKTGAIRSPQTRYLADLAPTIRFLLGIESVTGPGLGEPLAELLAGVSSNAAAVVLARK